MQERGAMQKTILLCNLKNGSIQDRQVAGDLQLGQKFLPESHAWTRIGRVCQPW